MKVKKLLVSLVWALTLWNVGCANSVLSEGLDVTATSESESEEGIESELEIIEKTPSSSEVSTDGDHGIKTYESGSYLVGTDIPAGEYLIEVSEKTLAYVEVATDSSGKLESVITNHNFRNRIYISVNSGEYLNFTSGKAVLASEADPYESNGTYPAGMYLVGKDIPAGEYTISVVKGGFLDTGYLELTSTSRGNTDSVIKKDNFETEKNQILEEGQYLFLSGAYIGNSEISADES